jgi:hypothetical protein
MAADLLAGKHIKCPRCKTVFAIPELEEEPEMESPRVARGRTRPTDEEGERRPRRRDRSAQEGMKPATLALVLVGATVGAVLVIAGGTWLVLRSLKPKEDAVAGAPGGVNPVGPNRAGRPGPVNQPAPPPPNVPRGTQVGNLALEIEGEDIDGNRFRLSDYQGKVVLLDFWGNW